jgi:hypothetical protein
MMQITYVNLRLCATFTVLILTVWIVGSARLYRMALSVLLGLGSNSEYGPVS